ncbi:MAG: hypothetical protein N3B12_02885 [Armatimonadetes bacterium]|nr:hypothetical protein [Armatimonadota bacterium]
MGKPVKQFSDEALAQMRAHPWPGNIRELQNAVERAVILCNGDTIRPEHLMLSSPSDTSKYQDTGHSKTLATVTITPTEQITKPETREPEQLSDLPVTASLRDVELFHIRRVLHHTNWNQSAAAQLLGIDRKTLRNKIREFKLEK